MLRGKGGRAPSQKMKTVLHFLPQHSFSGSPKSPFHDNSSSGRVQCTHCSQLMGANAPAATVLKSPLISSTFYSRFQKFNATMSYPLVRGASLHEFWECFSKLLSVQINLYYKGVNGSRIKSLKKRWMTLAHEHFGNRVTLREQSLSLKKMPVLWTVTTSDP